MIIINDKSYSFSELKVVAIAKLKNNKVEDWELDFWNFILDWYNDEKSTINIRTSGSTGIPKTIVHSKKNMIVSANSTCTYFNLNDTNSALLCLSVKTIGGIMMVVRAMVSKIKLIIIAPNSNPLKNIKSKIDFVAMVPFQVQKSLNENKEKWNFIDKVIIGGGKINNTLKSQLIENKINAFSTFGMTETISHIALNRIGVEEKYSALGSTSFKIDSNNCLVIDAPHLGIQNLQTNDIVDLKNNKEFIWLGRLDLAIETGGVKVIPEIVEQKIETLLQNRFFISSIPDDLLNNKIVLIIEGLNSNITLEMLKNVLTKYECPKKIYYVNKFIEVKNNKISRTKTMELIEFN